MEDTEKSKVLPKNKNTTAARNRLEELNRLNQEYLQTATTEADVHFYNAVQSLLHATALKLYGYTKDKDYQIEADLHLLNAQLEHIRLLEAAADKDKAPVKVVLVPQGQGIEYTDQRQ